MKEDVKASIQSTEKESAKKTNINSSETIKEASSFALNGFKALHNRKKRYYLGILIGVIIGMIVSYVLSITTK